MRVLVTRPQPGAARTAARLAGLGHEPVVAPLLVIEPGGEAPPGEAFDAVLVTSAQAVPFLDALPRDRPAFAVGARTAQALREAGFTRVTTGPGDAAGLARLIAGAMPPGAALLHPAGRDRKAEPGASLAAAGFRVLAWTAYRAGAVPRLPEAARGALDAHAIDAVLHFSRRTAELLLRLADAEGCGPPLARAAHLCLSEDVAAPLHAAGLQATVAERPDEAALFAASGPGSPVSLRALSRC